MFADRGHHLNLDSRSQAWVRCVNTKECFFVYLILMLANIFVLVVEFAGKSAFDRLFVVICEGLINAFLAGEVIAGLIIYHWSYFKQWYHVVDFVLTMLCLVFYVIFIEEATPGQGGVVDFELESILLGFRYTFQTLRVVSLLAQSKDRKNMLACCVITKC